MKTENKKPTSWIDEEMTRNQVYAIERLWKVLHAKGWNIPEWEYWFENMGDDTYKLVQQFTKGEANQVITIMKGLQEALWMGLDLKTSITRYNSENI